MYNIKISNLPFIIVFVSSLIPMFGAFLNINVFHAPAAMLFFTLVVSSVIIQKQPYIQKNWITFSFVVVMLLLVIQVITKRGFVILAMGGYVTIFALFFNSYLLNGNGASIKTIIQRVSFIYKFLLIGMLVEFILIIVGLQPILDEIFQYGRGYKSYNGADVLRYFGLFYNAGGLNSILLGSQIAGMISLFSIIWFVGIRIAKIEKMLVNSTTFWIILSCFLFIITVNGTNFFLFVAAVCIYTLIVQNKQRLISWSVIVISTAVLYFLISKGYLLSRLFNQDIVNLQPDQIEFFTKYGILHEVINLSTMEFYIHAFLAPVKQWVLAGYVDKLIGVGDRLVREGHVFVGGDFGFAAGLLAAGFIFSFVFVITIFATCIPCLKLPSSRFKEQNLWSVIGVTNAVIAILWLFSTVHYNQAFENPGGIALFALHLALSNYCKMRFYKFKLGSVKKLVV